MPVTSQIEQMTQIQIPKAHLLSGCHVTVINDRLDDVTILRRKSPGLNQGLVPHRIEAERGRIAYEAVTTEVCFPHPGTGLEHAADPRIAVGFRVAAEQHAKHAQLDERLQRRVQEGFR